MRHPPAVAVAITLDDGAGELKVEWTELREFWCMTISMHTLLLPDRARVLLVWPDTFERVVFPNSRRMADGRHRAERWRW